MVPKFQLTRLYHRFKFSTTLLPYPLFCLTHLVAARGIQAGAFEADYKSVDDLLHRPILEDVDYVPLKWKKGILDKPIFPMSYSLFIRILRRVILVAGFPFLPRCYAFRVGAGAQLDGCLTTALRNFIMSHSTDVCENNYMSEHVREDLIKCRFGAFAGTNDPLFDLLWDISMQNDPGAPIDPTPQQKLDLESRRDVTELKGRLEALQKSGPKTDISRVKALLENLRQRLYTLVVADSRERYFTEAAKLRSRGLSTIHLRSSEPPPYSDHTTLNIKGLVELFVGHTISDDGKPSQEFIFDSHAEERSEKAMAWLLSYMAKAWTLLAATGSLVCSGDQELLEQKSTDQKSPGKPTCFVCKADFDRRRNLTRHVKAQHLQILSTPFQCPECARLGLPPYTSSSPQDWSSHTEKVHGKRHAPYLTNDLSSDCIASQDYAVPHDCFVCTDSVPASRAGAITHYSRHTAVLSSKKLFMCLECVSSEVEGAKLASYSGIEMLYHLGENHSHPDIGCCPLCAWYGSVRGLRTHVRGHFKKDPVPCQMCDTKDASKFDSYDSWYSHRELAHGRDVLSGLKAPKRTEVQQTTAGAKRKRSRCHEMEFKLDFEGSSGPEQKRARVSVGDEVGASEDFNGGKGDFMDNSLDYPSCDSLSVSSLSTSLGLDTPQTEFFPVDSFEHILWADRSFQDGMDDDTILSHDLDLLLKKESPGSLATKDDWVDIVYADTGHTGPKDGSDATANLDLDIHLDLGHAHLVKLNEMCFAWPPQDEGLGEWGDEEREGFSNWVVQNTLPINQSQRSASLSFLLILVLSSLLFVIFPLSLRAGGQSSATAPSLSVN